MAQDSYLQFDNDNKKKYTYSYNYQKRKGRLKTLNPIYTIEVIGLNLRHIVDRTYMLLRCDEM